MSAAASLRASTKYPQSPQSGATALVLVPAARNVHWHPGKQRGLPRGIFKAEKSPPDPANQAPSNVVPGTTTYVHVQPGIE